MRGIIFAAVYLRCVCCFPVVHSSCVGGRRYGYCNGATSCALVVSVCGGVASSCLSRAADGTNVLTPGAEFMPGANAARPRRSRSHKPRPSSPSALAETHGRTGNALQLL